MDKKQFNVNIGNLLRDFREEKNLTQRSMAEKAGVTLNYLGQVERGEKSITVYCLFQLLEANDISVSEFIERV